MTSRRERRLAQAARGEENLSGLTPAQARAEAEARAQAEAQAASAAAQSRRQESEASRARSRRALDAPVDAVHAERTSQARARDREAHRLLRELAEKEQAASFPSRRSLRQQNEPAESRETDRAPRPVGDVPAESLPIVSPAQPEVPRRPSLPPSSAGAPFREPTPTMPVKIPKNPAGEPVLGPETGSFRALSHEQIAAARELLKAQAKTQAEMLAEPKASGTTVDAEQRKQQVARAEREAVLSRRAQARQRLAEETRRDVEATRKAGPAPTAADNLAMVTPLEYVKIPGIPHPVMKPPTTHHVPVVTDRTPKQRSGSGQAVAHEAAPVSARFAHGLEPLGVQSSRADRERIVLLGIGAIGIVALIVAVLIVLLGR